MSIKKITITSIITVLLLLLAAAFTAAPAEAVPSGTAYPVEGGNIYIENGVLTGYDGEITHVTVPAGVTKIGAGAFKECKSLISITFPDTLTTIGDDAFYRCESLQKLVIPTGVTKIGAGAFYVCKSLISVSLPDTLTTIGDDAFGHCKSLQKIVIPNSVSYIGNFAFACCTVLTDVVLPNNLTEIRDGLFNACGLTSIVVPDSVEVIKIGAFSYCRNLKDVDLPEGLQDIEELAFEGTALEELIIPRSVTTLGGGEDAHYIPFGECPALILCVYPDTYACEYVKANNLNYKVIGFEFTDSNLDISLTEEYVYTGEEIKPEPIIVFTGDDGSTVTLDLGIDYTLSYADNIEVGTATLIVTGKNGYSGSVSSTFKIAATGRYYLNDSQTQWLVYNSKGHIVDYGYTGENYITELEIPGEIEGVPITTIDEYCFSNYGGLNGDEYLQHVVIGEGINVIDDFAFSGCRNLTTVQLPSSLTHIGVWSFAYCDSLVGIEIPDSVRSIGEGAFQWSQSLSSVKLPSGLRTLQSMTFNYCTSLREIIIPASVQYIIDATFSNVSPLEVTFEGNAPTLQYPTSDYIPFEEGTVMNFKCNAVTDNIDDYGFTIHKNHSFNNRICINCGACEVTGGIIYIEDGVVTGYEGEITSVTFPEGAAVTKIGASAFYQCDSLTDIEIPETVTKIDSYAFYYCENLAAIEIPASVEEIGIKAFCGCQKVTKLDFEEGSRLKTIKYSAFNYCYRLTTIDVPEGVTTIGEEAFAICLFAKNITIPSTVTEIGPYAFRDCEALTRVVFNEGSQLQKIEEGTFRECLKLTDIVLPSTVKEIGSEAFYECSSLTDIEIPVAVTEIGKWAFDDCDSLTAIEIPATVTEIGASAFYNCDNLTKLEFEEGSALRTIGSDAFAWCISLTDIEIPAAVTEIGTATFFRCDNLTEVEFEEESALKTIGEEAFWTCKNLTAIEIPAAVTEIGKWAFKDLTSLEVTFEGNITPTMPRDAFETSTVMNFKCNVVTDSIEDYGFTIYKHHSYASYQCTGCGEWDPSAVRALNADNTTIGTISWEEYNGKAYEPKPTVTFTDADGNQITLAEGTDFEFTYTDNINAGTGTVTVTGINGYAGSVSKTFIIKPYDIIAFSGMGTEYEEYFYTGEPIEPKVTVSVNGVILVEGQDYTLSYRDNIEGGWASVTATGINNYTGTLSTSFTIKYEEFRHYLDNDETQWLVYNTAGEIVGFGYDNDNYITDLTVPAKIGNIDIAGLGSGCFAEDEHLTSVTLEEGIKYIGYTPFYKCTGLTTVILPSSLETIGEMAFIWCENLETVELQEGLTDIQGKAFYYCKSLKKIEIPASVETIAFNVFTDIGSLEVTFIGDAPELVYEYDHNVPFDQDTVMYFKCTADTANVDGKGFTVYKNHSFENGSCSLCGEGDPDMGLIKAGTASTSAGSLVQIPIHLEKNHGIVNLNLAVQYDRNAMELVDVTNGDVFGEGTLTANKNYAPDTAKLFWSDSLVSNIEATGTLAVLTFKVSDDAEAGNYEIQLICSPTEGAFDTKGKPVRFNAESGTVKIESFIYGDMNGDRLVDMTDVMVMKYYIAGFAGYKDLPAEPGNVDLKNGVNARDLMILERYLAKWKGYEYLPNTSDKLA